MMGFDFDGEAYAKASKHQKTWGSGLIAELELTGDETVLDLGCGDGVLTAELAARVPNGRVVGIDASPGMIEAARHRAGRNMSVHLKDINELDYDCEFDVVFSNATLHWIKDHSRLLRNVLRALRPGGTVRFNFAGAGNSSHFNRVVQDVMRLPAFVRYFKDFDWPWYMPEVEEYRHTVRGTGLTDASVWGENADRHFADAEEMVRWVDQPSLVPFLKSVNENDKKAFRTEVVERMVTMTVQEDGTCFETFRRINLLARKP